MLITVADYQSRVTNEMDRLVAELQELTGRYGSEEREAWNSSLPVLADVLAHSKLKDAHLYFRGEGHIDVEYPLPAASHWCDAVLLGRNADRSAAVIIELKHWLISGDKPGVREGLIHRQGRDQLHPSDQVRGYTEYCRRFHTAVQDAEASVDGCVLFTRSGSSYAYKQAPNTSLARAFPVFTVAANDVDCNIPDFLADRVTEPDEAFATAFAAGGYRQERGFVAQIGKQLLEPGQDPVVLLGNQRSALNICCERITHHVDNRTGDRGKRVIVVEGPPGSGKSVVAAKLWASLAIDPLTQSGDLVFTTTSVSQSSNWESLFRDAARHHGASGVIKKANQYFPATTQDVGRLRKRFGDDLFRDPQAWRQNLRELSGIQPPRTGSEDDCYLVSIVDEAHALINPEHGGGRGQFGFSPTLGPQAFHIMRASQLTVFFLDPEQGFRDRENTSVDDLQRWAEELGATFESISLAGAQFRCAGSKEYVEWLESIFSGMDARFAARNARRWRAVAEERTSAAAGRRVAEQVTPYVTGRKRGGMQFELVETPFELERALRARWNTGATVRLLASYARPWSTREFENPHEAPQQTWDFQIAAPEDSNEGIWRRPWNYVPRNGTDYTAFVQGKPGTYMATDPLCEVGCTYAVRGFDFDYVGLLWMSDLVWRENCWVVQSEHVHESGLLSSRRNAIQSPDTDSTEYQTLLAGVRQAYRILLTRAMKGIFVWVEDDETRDYLTVATGLDRFSH